MPLIDSHRASDNAAPQQATHRVRASVFAREAEWRLAGDRLFWRDREGAESGVVAAADIVAVRMTQEPRWGGRPRRFCRIVTREGVSLIVASSHYAGVSRREDRDESWRALVGGIVEAVARANPQARLRKGLSAGAWWSAVAALVALGVALATGYALRGALLFTPRLWLGIALVGVGLPNIGRWLAANRPGLLDPKRPFD